MKRAWFRTTKSGNSVRVREKDSELKRLVQRKCRKARNSYVEMPEETKVGTEALASIDCASKKKV